MAATLRWQADPARRTRILTEAADEKTPGVREQAIAELRSLALVPANKEPMLGDNQVKAALLASASETPPLNPPRRSKVAGIRLITIKSMAFCEVTLIMS